MNPDALAAAHALPDRWLAAFNAADLAAITALYVPDARLWGTTAPQAIDHPTGVRAYFARVFDLHPRPRMVLIERRGRALGEGVVIQSGRYDLELAPGRVLAARFTLVLRLEADAPVAPGAGIASWRIVEHHSSAVPDPPDPWRRDCHSALTGILR